MKSKTPDSGRKEADVNTGHVSTQNAPARRSMHTPGPWRIDCLSAQRGLEIKGANGNTVIVEEDYFHFPEEMGAGQRESIGNELAANARLIAAAPDMLQVLDLVMAEWNSDPRSTQCFDSAIINKARAVLAKVEGR